MDFKTVKENLLQLEKPEILITGEITTATYEYVALSLAYLRSRNSPPLKVTIDSGGGDVDPGLDIYDLIRLYEGETTALVVREAGSMAAVVLQACNKRHCAVQAGILIHHVSRKRVSLDVLTNKKRYETLVRNMQKSQERIYKILCERTKKPLKGIILECKKDRFMPSTEAKEFGLIDEIV